MNICYICCIHNFGFDLSVIISTNLVQNEISNIFKTHHFTGLSGLVEIGVFTMSTIGYQTWDE